MLSLTKLMRAASLFVFFAAINLRCDDNAALLPYTDIPANPSDMSVAIAAPAPALLANSPAPLTNSDVFYEVDLDPASFRNAKMSHTNLILALVQPEERDASGNIAGGDINSGIMREVEEGVLNDVSQPFSSPDDPTKIAFIRMDVTQNDWIWNYFNDGSATVSVNHNNGTPQYLYFNQGNLVSVLVGNRDDSAFASWVRNNIARTAPTAPAPITEDQASALQNDSMTNEMLDTTTLDDNSSDAMQSADDMQETNEPALPAADDLLVDDTSQDATPYDAPQDDAVDSEPTDQAVQ